MTEPLDQYREQRDFAATPAPVPPEEPLGLRRGSYGLRMKPKPEPT